MKNAVKLILVIFSITCFTCFPLLARAEEGKADQEYSFEDELRFLQEENIVSIASRRLQSVGKAPAIVTVITDQEIKNMGFQNLFEVLRIVPGVDVFTEAQLGGDRMSFRGLKSKAPAQIKALIDGHPLNDFRSGEIIEAFYELPVDFIKRIEIIRGPGSALYGENAFTGVIDIITKDT